MPQALDYSSNVYLSVLLTPSSIYKSHPIQLPSGSVNVNDLGTVGALPDVKILSVPKDEWLDVGDDIIKSLTNDKTNVLRVDVQTPKQRIKRGGDEL